LKGPWSLHALTELSELLDRFARDDDVVASNRLSTLELLRAIGPHRRSVHGLPKHGLTWFHDELDRIEQPFGVSIDASDPDLSESSIERLHDAGLFVYAWNIPSRDRLRELAGAGVDGAIFDDPSWALR
jgi:glycerophosphoryl diester phosphodiesterase